MEKAYLFWKWKDNLILKFFGPMSVFQINKFQLGILLGHWEEWLKDK